LFSKEERIIMDWKQFLKPDWRKIVVFIVLFIFFCLFEWGIIISQTNRGFPFPYSSMTFGELIVPFNLVNFIADIAVWYIISCLIVGVYDKYKGKCKGCLDRNHEKIIIKKRKNR
jgi:hypothetical protein